MDEKDLLDKLHQELTQAVDNGRLPREALQYFEDRRIQITGHVTGSILMTGNNTKIEQHHHHYPAKQSPEVELLKTSLQVSQQQWQDLIAQPAGRLYPGLHSYKISDAANFFGRKAIVQELLPITQNCRVLWLHGRSGVGKSSLLQAGLIPKLLLEPRACVILVRLFDRPPVKALQQEIFKSAWSANLVLAGMELATFLRAAADCLEQAPLWIIFDQFEEFFFYQSEKEQAEFAEQLCLCVNDPYLPVHFVFALRSDCFGETAPLRKRLPPESSREYFLRLLTHAEAHQVITGPLSRIGVSCPDALIQTILTDLGEKSCESPQLQLVCERLYGSLPADAKEILPQHYAALGGARGVLQNYVRQLLTNPQNGFETRSQAACYLLSTLVTPEGTKDRRQAAGWYQDERLRRIILPQIAQQGMPSLHALPKNQELQHLAVAELRRYVSLSEAELLNLPREAGQAITDWYLFLQQKVLVDELVYLLSDLRLISEVEDSSAAYELAHDYLIPEVGKLLDAEDLEARRVQRMLAQKVLEFEEHRFLLEPRELELVFKQAANPKLLLTEAEKRLVLLSAARHGSGREGIGLVGIQGLAWLRQVWQDDSLPETVRLGAAGCLGEHEDRPAVEELRSTLNRPANRAAEHQAVRLLAHYRHAAPRSGGETPPVRLSLQQRLTIFFHQARLRVRDGKTEHVRARVVGMATGAGCTAIMVVLSTLGGIADGTTGIQVTAGDRLLSLIFLAILAAVGGLLFAEVTTVTRLVIRRWWWPWRALLLAGVGCLSGAVLFFALNGHLRPWFSGAFLGLALAFVPPGPPSRTTRLRLSLALAVSLILSGFSLFYIIPDEGWLTASAAALAVSLFSTVYLDPGGAVRRLNLRS